MWRRLLPLLLAACSGGEQASGKARGQGRHPDAERVALQCAQAVEEAREGNPAEAIPVLIRGCKKIYYDVGCEEAWEQAERAAPSQRIDLIIRGCRAAYCPILPRPPAMCAGKPSETELRAGWQELHRAILELELGPALAVRLSARLEEIASASTSIDIPRPPAAPPRPDLTVVIDERGVEVEGRRVLDAGALAAGAGLEVVEDALRAAAAGRSDVGVTLHAASGLPYQHVVRVLEAARAAGVSRVGLSTQ